MALEVKNLTCIYNKGTSMQHIAVDNVSFSVSEGEFLGVIGHTGSGKSTLMQQLNGLLKPDSGEIIVDGEALHSKGVVMKKIRFKVGMVFQYPEYQLFEETVYADIAYGPKNMGITGDELKNRVKKAIGLVGLDFEKYKDASPFELSGGQKRRVAIAGVLAMEPRYLILDEPTAGLDPKGRKDILNVVSDFHIKQKMAVILVTHRMEDVANFADRILVLNKGEIDMEGTPREVFKNADRLVEVGLGVPEITKLTSLLEKEGFENIHSLSVEELRDKILLRLGKGEKNA